MIVYPASKTAHAEFWKALRAAGIPICASWLSSPVNLCDARADPDDWRELWKRNIAEAAAADVVLFYAAKGERQCGALIECGAALAAGKQVYVVSPYTWTFSEHPRCSTFADLAGAVEAIRENDQ